MSYQPRSSARSALNIYWQGIAAFLTESPIYTNAGAYYVNSFDNTLFQVLVLFPRKTPEEVALLAQPWLGELKVLGITPDISEILQHPTVRKATAVVSEVSGGEILVGISLFGARILPTRLCESGESLSGLFTTLQGIADDGGQFINVGIKPTLEVAGNPNNAVFPPFRTMQSMCIVIGYGFFRIHRIVDGVSDICTRNWNDTASWDEQFSGTRTVTALASRLAEIAPETGAYLNEVNIRDLSTEGTYAYTGGCL